ncbi:hypothetical protein [Dechloromonas sp. A34]|uniref:hypothetical protein n=1 Tax=Dechloromonas sp. A34 TaxID=447588 RepID=UPI002249054E|nr:hypothetical protein [Dechloromonas sp. A34]
MLGGFQLLYPALHLLQVVACRLLRGRWQGRLGPPVFIGVAAAVEIRLGQRLGIARLRGRLGIDQDDVEGLFAHCVRGVGELEVQRQQQGVRQQRQADC